MTMVGLLVLMLIDIRGGEFVCKMRLSEIDFFLRLSLLILHSEAIHHCNFMSSLPYVITYESILYICCYTL